MAFHLDGPPDQLKPLDGVGDDSPRVVGPVPITVWRLDDTEATTEPGAGLALRLAQQLVLVYTRRGETVVDFDHDDGLRVAAAEAGRTYAAVANADEALAHNDRGGTVSLISLRWPRETDPATADQIVAVLSACRSVTSSDVGVVAAIRSAQPAHPGATFADHEHALRVPVEQAGFTHVLQIVAISAPGERDQFLYHATEDEAIQAAHSAPDGRVLHIDLLVFQRQES